jgi:hypothetical protein
MLNTAYSVKAFSQEKSNSYSYYESGRESSLFSTQRTFRGKKSLHVAIDLLLAMFGPLRIHSFSFFLCAFRNSYIVYVVCMISEALISIVYFISCVERKLFCSNLSIELKNKAAICMRIVSLREKDALGS